MQPSFVRNAKFARTPVQAVFGVQEPHTYHGSFTFISELYTGSISDCELAIQSGILPLFDTVPSGRQVIADRGFDIQDLPVKPKLLLNIPAFKGSRTFLPLSEVVQTQKIASVRIHVEKAIGRVKRKLCRGGLQQSVELCQDKTVAGHPACFGTLPS